MQIIGLSGGIASGKSTAANYLRQKGLPVIDADELAREELQPGRSSHRQVCQVFPEARLSDGSIDRTKLANIIFSSPSARRTLETIIHPQVQRAMTQRIAWYWLQGYDRVVLDIPLLFETGLYRWMSYSIVICASTTTQLRRMQMRDAMPADQANARIAAQMPMAIKCARADVVIDNEGEMDDLYRNLDTVLASRRPNCLYHRLFLHMLPLGMTMSLLITITLWVIKVM